MSVVSNWYHGSPTRLEFLRLGSTITRNRDIARIFSHKPTLVATDDDGRTFHNGSASGYLYAVEGVAEDDVYPHPETTMAAGVEWLTKRELRLVLLDETEVLEEERLTERDEEVLWQQRKLLG